MSHFDPDESPDWDDDMGAFEQQLRSLCPTPPNPLLESVDASLEKSPKHPAVVTAGSRASSMWQPVISHSLTAAIGVAIGVAVMLARTPNALPVMDNANGTGPNGTAMNAGTGNPSAQLPAIGASEKPTEYASNDDASPEHNQQAKPSWRSNRFSQTNLNSRPLTVFGSLDHVLAQIEYWNTQPVPNDPDPTYESDASDDWPSQLDELPVDKPVLSPRSFDQFLDELTQTNGLERFENVVILGDTAPFAVPASAGIADLRTRPIPPEGGTTNNSALSPRAEGPALTLPSHLRAQS